jgi:hypothetical protein
MATQGAALTIYGPGLQPEDMLYMPSMPILKKHLYQFEGLEHDRPGQPPGGLRIMNCRLEACLMVLSELH